MFLLTDKPIDSNRLKNELANSKAGALVTFEGRVRHVNEGHEVILLHYEAHQALAGQEAEKILKEAEEKFKAIESRCVHRLGDLIVGDISVWVGVLAEHRKDAFGACQYIIDQLKIRLPIWKKEYYKQGEPIWVNSEKT